MRKIILLIYLFFCCNEFVELNGDPLYRNFENHTNNDNSCQIFQSLSSIDCLNVVIESSDSENYINCFNDLLLTTVNVLSWNILMERNILDNLQIEFECSIYLIFITTTESLKQIFSDHASKQTQRFYPYSKILIYNRTGLKNLNFNHQMLEYATRKAINVISMNWNNSTFTFNRVNFNNTIQSNHFDIKMFAIDEFINLLLKNENKILKIRASLFSCPPFVLYPDDKSIPFDGVEHRCLQEISKNWQMDYILRDFSKTITNPWTTVMVDLKKNVSDIALCSIWLNIIHYSEYTLSRYYDTQCVTFLVPEPSKINEAEYIYLPLHKNVWFAFGFALLMTSSVLRAITWVCGVIFQKQFKDKQFQLMSTVFLEATNTATGHGLVVFPQQESIKILILGWIFFTLLLGTAYTTRYTSILARPQYSKQVETFKDFADSNLVWEEEVAVNYVLDEIVATEIPDFIEVGKRFIKKQSDEERQRLIKERRMAKLVKV